MEKVLTLICGLPNAGKTTYSENFENVIHLDKFFKTYRKEKLSYEKCAEEASNSEGDVYIDGVYYNSFLRKKLLEAFKDYKKICIWMNTPIETCLERSGTGSKPASVVKFFSKMFEPPTEDEGWNEIIIK